MLPRLVYINSDTFPLCPFLVALHFPQRALFLSGLIGRLL